MIKGTGVDIIEITRIRSAITRYGRRFLQKIYLPSEIAYCETKADAAPYFAARFAAKEAAMKALGTGLSQLCWHDILIEHAPGGKPIIILQGAAQHLAAQQQITVMHLSISHCRDYAVAQAIAE